MIDDSIIAAVLIDRNIKTLNNIGCREKNGDSSRPNHIVLVETISNVIASVHVVPSILSSYWGIFEGLGG